jgi:hypothetical protein
MVTAARQMGPIQHSIPATNPTRSASLSGMALEYMYRPAALLFIVVEIDRDD